MVIAGAQFLQKAGEPATLIDRAYDQIKQAILDGELRPNQRLVEHELAAHFDISRTPIRSGLQMLEVDGLISRHRSSWVVREFRREDVISVYQVRMALEGFAARLVAQNASDESIAEIAAILDESEQPLESRSPAEQVVLNDSFHGAIVRAAQNPHLETMLRRNAQFYFEARLADLYTADDYAAGHAGHRAILQALRARDATLAEFLVRGHVETALEVYLNRVP